VTPALNKEHSQQSDQQQQHLDGCQNAEVAADTLEKENTFPVPVLKRQKQLNAAAPSLRPPARATGSGSSAAPEPTATLQAAPSQLKI